MLFVNKDEVLEMLRGADILGEVTAPAEILFSHANPDAASIALTILRETMLLNGSLGETNKSMVLSHSCALSAAIALMILQEAYALNEDNRSVVLAHPAPMDAAIALAILQDVGIDVEQSRKAVLSYPHPLDAAHVLCILHQSGLLIGDKGHERLTLFMRYSDILCSDTVKQAWRHLSNQTLSVSQFNHILEICHHDDSASTAIEDKQERVNAYLLKTVLHPVSVSMNPVTLFSVKSLMHDTVEPTLVKLSGSA